MRSMRPRQPLLYNVLNTVFKALKDLAEVPDTVAHMLEINNSNIGQANLTIPIKRVAKLLTVIVYGRQASNKWLKVGNGFSQRCVSEGGIGADPCGLQMLPMTINVVINWKALGKHP
ncbi:hypothetical protein GEM_4173 [Burkholderia cepacia GG4]|uniref:Uncharacterized protein n=1 Tax=Burkholderia cepacia GG4 TaxID=1009846 RepID=A0A9W3K4E5_BURCE|nr:hypothetical protein GEM_4173 [Burkholderia cepacia GG4]